MAMNVFVVLPLLLLIADARDFARFPVPNSSFGNVNTTRRLKLATIPVSGPKTTLATLPQPVDSKGIGQFRIATRRYEAILPSCVQDAINAREHWFIMRMLQPLCRIPPITGSYLTGCFMIALWSWAFNGNMPPPAFTFDLVKIQQGQVWRCFTPLLLLGQLWLEFGLLAQSVAMYMSGVEIGLCKRPEKFVEMLTFAVTTLSLYGLAEAHYGHGHSLMDNLPTSLGIFLIYYWSRMYEGTMVNCFDLIQLPSEWVPFLILIQNGLFGHFSRMDLAAIAFAYLYYYALAEAEALAPFRALATRRFRSLYERYLNEMP
ncbi:Derlin [Babesia duncani]|uniref:Derlin n=1 Tax=Babesia duncani TaxID=323732 RepID=A0AAD9PNB7_9APIC|nr:Derlin [Babesia duncani]